MRAVSYTHLDVYKRQVHWNVDDPAAGIFFGERHRRFTADFDVLF